MKNKKLIKVKREIEVVTKENKEIETINIDHISVAQLLTVFTPYERGDPLLYDPYDISREQLQKLNAWLASPVIYNERLNYILACFGIYEDLV